MTANEMKVKADLVRTMDMYVREIIGNDTITEYWLMYGLPDGSDSLDIISYLEDDAEIFEEWVAAFKHCLWLERRGVC